jgi:hypothetical protein
MTNMAERPSGGLQSEAGEDAEAAAEAVAGIEPVLDDASEVPPEQATADGWSASSPEVKEWAAASDRAFGFDPGGGDVADEAP